MKRRIYLACYLTLFGLLLNSDAAETPASGEELYQQACATCHGEQLQGGQTQSLVDAVWQFGEGRSSMRRNIKHGIGDFDMPAFEAALTDEQINRIIDFILEQEEKGGATRPPPPEKLFTLDYEIDVQVWAEGLDIPWAIAFLNEQRALVTERPGRLRLVINDELQAEPVAGIPEVVHEGQGGLLDVAVDPEHSENGWVYLAYSHALPEGSEDRRPPAMTRLVRGRIHNNRWTDEQVVFEAPSESYLESRHHYGCRIVFDSEGYLYFSIGERGHRHHAQDLTRPNGKVHRIHRDGSIPKDNPFVHRDDFQPTIFTFGNRNPQGLAVHPVTGRVWETEHGPYGGDELNLLTAGRNYGWPIITYGRAYDGGIISEYWERSGMEQPSLYWKPSIAVCGIDFVEGDLFPRWRDKLLVGALRFEELRLLDLEDNRVLHQEIILKNAGRVRDVGCGPDGAIYVVLNGPGMILRLTPLRDLNVPPEDRL